MKPSHKDHTTYNRITKAWLDGIYTDIEYLHRCENIGDDNAGRYFGRLALARINRMMLRTLRNSSKLNG